VLPQTNATLVKIERTGGTASGGYSEDYDSPATDPEASGGEGEDLWNGKRPGYWIERRQRVTEGNTSRVIVTRTLLLDRGLPEFGFEEGDHVTVEHAGSTKRGKVAAIEDRAIPNQGLHSLRLTMEDA
jgi:hypothetical protein